MRSHIMPIHRDFWLFGAVSDKYIEHVELRHKEVEGKKKKKKHGPNYVSREPLDLLVCFIECASFVPIPIKLFEWTLFSWSGDTASEPDNSRENFICIIAIDDKSNEKASRVGNKISQN